MATNNIKIFDENKGNIMSTQEYSTNAQRLNGVQQGIASSMLQNKTLYQLSLVAYAIGQMMVNNGLDANDDNAVSAFVGNLSNTIVQKVVDKASTAEAQAGTDANKFMTSDTTRAAINVLKATSQMATAGTDDTHWMTPALVKQMVNIGISNFNYVKLYDRTFTQTAGENITTQLPSTIFNYTDVIFYVKTIPLNMITGPVSINFGNISYDIGASDNTDDEYLIINAKTIKDIFLIQSTEVGVKISSSDGLTSNNKYSSLFRYFVKSVLQSQGISYRSRSSDESHRSIVTIQVFGANYTILSS